MRDTTGSAAAPAARYKKIGEEVSWHSSLRHQAIPIPEPLKGSRFPLICTFAKCRVGNCSPLTTQEPSRTLIEGLALARSRLGIRADFRTFGTTMQSLRNQSHPQIILNLNYIIVRSFVLCSAPKSPI